ncbi:proline racemase family protein [Rhodopirellula sp. JC740]|uniref:Proline racemase family protein n=1 Tax=Rhodopirellula halodulae TaxID=2894198 RepID=A0ABS8ND53_9BACT|nr:proline racemase family protein [Rhodopirellula sp. JC740]MCC9640768.1 proline racemase family protein [Rhodopirellula sp. JC740]
MMLPERVQVLDSHTGGEPTRLVIGLETALLGQSMAERRLYLREHFTQLGAPIVNEPRGNDIIVGAWLCPAVDPSCFAGVVFFNNVGVLLMCGHATIGLVATLAWQGLLAPGTHRLETPVGIVEVTLHNDLQTVSFENVPSERYQADVPLRVADATAIPTASITGDIAYGGNWFYLVENHGLDLDLTHVDKLMSATLQIKAALREQGITGRDGAEIDHVELVGPSETADAKNFVLCPGNAYDRSPCGTGTSAKVACLAEAGKLRPGEVFHQESITGSRFEATYRRGENGEIIPRLTGSAEVVAETTLLFGG